MHDKPIVIIHGWSDDYVSFLGLADWLRDELDADVRDLFLGDYITLDDEVTFDDIAAAMEAAWKRERLPRGPRSVDVVVHSTGGLVVRDWMTRHFQPSTNPVHRLLMLAPANFGSPLAHRGRAWMGRVIKADMSKPKLFQTGTHVLKGLELASPYSWALAERDRFGRARWYGKDRVLATVLVGNSGYGGIIGAFSDTDGSDGTVRVATAHLDPARLEVDFVGKAKRPSAKFTQAKGRTAFGVMQGENHSSIKFEYEDPDDESDRGRIELPSEPVREWVKRALTVTDAGFAAHCGALEAHTEQVMAAAPKKSHYHGFQHTVFLVEDQFGDRVADYMIEFYAERDDSKDRFMQNFQEKVIAHVHEYKDDASYRAVLVDTDELDHWLAKRTDDAGRHFEAFRMSLTATPEFVPPEAPDVPRSREEEHGHRGGRMVGYMTAGDEQIGGVRITMAKLREFFQPNRTLLVRIRIERHQDPSVFRILGRDEADRSLGYETGSED